MLTVEQEMQAIRVAVEDWERGVLRRAEQAAARKAAQKAAEKAAEAAARSDLGRVHAIADQLPWPWRRASVTFRIGCHPESSRCRWGVYTTKNEIWIGPGAFASEARLRGVVAHELAHAWQWANSPARRTRDLKDHATVGEQSRERAADCMAEVWGAPLGSYWNCTPGALQVMRDVWAANRCPASPCKSPTPRD